MKANRLTPQSALMLARIFGLLFATIGVAGYALWVAGGALVRDGNWVGVDFQVYYQAAKVLGRGENIYTAGISPPYVYPPLFALLVYPLSLLHITPATIVWKCLQHLCLLIAGLIFTRMSPPGSRPLVAGVLFLGLLLVPLREEIRVGESNSLILALVVGAVACASPTKHEGRRTKDDPPATSNQQPATSSYAIFIGGLLLALAVSIKVLPVLVLAYFWWRGPRALAAWATVGFFALQILTLLISSANTRHYWLVEFPALFGQAFPYLDNQSLNAFFSRALLPSDPTYPNLQVASGESLRPILTWTSNLVVLAATTWVLWKSGPRTTGQVESKVRLVLEVGLVLLTTHLVSGSTWLHHLVALSVPVTGLLGAWWVRRTEGKWPVVGFGLLVLGLLLAGVVLARKPEEWVLLADAIAPGNALIALLASSLPMIIVIGLWIAVARQLWRIGRVTSDE